MSTGDSVSTNIHRSAWRQFVTLFIKDIRQELRTREMLSSMGVYAVLVLVIFGAALSQASAQLDILSLSGGLVWAMVTFTSLLGLNRSFQAEKEESSLEGLLLVPMDRSVIFLAKSASNLVFLLAVELIACPLYYFFFLSGLPVSDSLALLLPLFLAGSVGIAAVGTLLATITSSARSKDILLAILFIPAIFPLLYAVVSASSVALVGGEGVMAVYLPGLAMALGYDVIMVSVSWLLYGFVISS